MSLPPLVGFISDDPTTEVVFAWLATGAQLANGGLRVLLVNTDPSGLVERMFPEVEQVLPQTGGSGALNLLRNPEARPERLDLGSLKLSLFGRAPERGTLAFIPAYRAHEAPDPTLAERAPEQVRSFALTLRRQLCDHDRFDLVLALLPPGDTALGTALLQECTALAVQLCAPVLPEEAPLEPGPGPVRRVLVTIGNSYASPAQLYFPRVILADGEPPRSVLRDANVIARSEVLAARIRRDLNSHPRLLRARARDCAREADWDGLEACFGALWEASRDEALALFQEEMGRRPRVPHQVGASALRAVANRGDLSPADLLHLASQTVRTFRWTEPTPDAELAAKILEHLLATQESGARVPLPGRLVVETADALCHWVLWRQACGASREETWPILMRVHGLLAQRLRLPMRLADEARWARAAATFTRLTGDSALVNDLRDCLDLLARHLPQNHLRTASLALLYCAIGLQRSEMFEEVIALCDRLIPEEPEIGLYRRALAWAHTGFYGDALVDLQALGRIDQEAALKTLVDPDFRPLWSVAGDPKLKVPLPR